MASNVEEFLKEPSEEALEKCTKEQLLLVAAHYNIELTKSDKKLKESILKNLRGTLEEEGVLVAKLHVPSNVDSEVKLKEMVLREKELELETVKCRLEHDRIALKEKELHRELELRKLEGQERERDRAFCPNFASVVSSLTDLLSPKIDFVWTDSCQQAFDNAKALLVNAPILAAPNFKNAFKLAVDASENGAGAVLLQDDDQGIEHPVCFFSKKFNSHQRNYSVIEKEALAMILAVQHFEVYLSSGNPIEVLTDHNPLVFLQRSCNSNQRLMRWSLFLQSFPLQIHHKGKENVLADALSRV